MKTIFLDLDGVLADFCGGISEVFGCDLRNVPQWDIPGYLKMQPEDFWDEIKLRGRYFWSELDKYEWSDALFTVANRVADQVYFLTSPIKDPNCHKGKMEWVRKHYPGMVSRTILTGHKGLLSAPDRLLIDDGTHNIEMFEGMGEGDTILWPMPWNADSHYRDLDRPTDVVMHLEQL